MHKYECIPLRNSMLYTLFLADNTDQVVKPSNQENSKLTLKFNIEKMEYLYVCRKNYKLP